MTEIKLSARARTALGVEYRWKPREKMPGEVPPRTIAFQPWEPLPELVWNVREGAEKAQELPSVGLAT